MIVYWQINEAIESINEWNIKDVRHKYVRANVNDKLQQIMQDLQPKINLNGIKF